MAAEALNCDPFVRALVGAGFSDITIKDVGPGAVDMIADRWHAYGLRLAPPAPPGTISGYLGKPTSLMGPGSVLIGVSVARCLRLPIWLWS